MADMNLVPVTGIVQNITSMRDNCCELLVSIRNSDGITNFVVGPDSYVINEVRLRPGMSVIAFYDANLAIPLISRPSTGLSSSDEKIQTKICTRATSTKT